MNLSSIKEITIPQGVVTKIVAGGKTLWEKVVEVLYHNLVPTSQDGTGAIFNGVGYQVGVYPASSGVGTSTDTKAVCTGYIPYNLTETTGQTIRIKGANLHMDTSVSGYSHFGRIAFATGEANSKTFLKSITPTATTSYFSITKSTDGVFTLVPKPAIIKQYLGYNYASKLWIRFGMENTGEVPIVTLDEEIV